MTTLYNLLDLNFLRLGLTADGRCGCDQCTKRRAEQLQGDLRKKWGGL